MMGLMALVLCGCATGGAPSPLPALLATRAGPVVPPDIDMDGYANEDDRCPQVRGVAPFGCPERNRDGDEFLDWRDRCPDDPGVEPDGCPTPDSDKDGLLDPDDDCRDTPETRNGYLDLDGCADELPQDLVEIATIRGVVFGERDDLQSRPYPLLDRVVAVLAKYPEVRVEVAVHLASTDYSDMLYGKNPSQRRADAVKKYLVEHGIDAGRIETRGPLGDEWLVSNKTAAGRAKNRRIEITPISPW